MTVLTGAIGRRDTRVAALTTDALLVLTGSLFVAGMAQLYLKLPFTPVPITGQTLAVLLVGGAFGALRGGASLLLYLGWGAAGLPFFAEGKSGVEYLTTTFPTGGYLWGFVIAAVVVGWLTERGWGHDVGRALGAMLIASIVIYLAGVPWLTAALHAPVVNHSDELAQAIGCGSGLECGLYPFVVGDVLKLLLASLLLPVATRFSTGRRKDAPSTLDLVIRG